MLNVQGALGDGSTRSTTEAAEIEGRVEKRVVFQGSEETFELMEQRQAFRCRLPTFSLRSVVNRSEAHDPRVAADNCPGRQYAQRLPVVFVCGFLAAEDEHGRAVVDARRIGRGDGALGVETGLERGQLLRGGSLRGCAQGRRPGRIASKQMRIVIHHPRRSSSARSFSCCTGVNAASALSVSSQ